MLAAVAAAGATASGLAFNELGSVPDGAGTPRRSADRAVAGGGPAGPIAARPAGWEPLCTESDFGSWDWWDAKSAKNAPKCDM